MSGLAIDTQTRHQNLDPDQGSSPVLGSIPEDEDQVLLLGLLGLIGGVIQAISAVVRWKEPNEAGVGVFHRLANLALQDLLPFLNDDLLPVLAQTEQHCLLPLLHLLLRLPHLHLVEHLDDLIVHSHT